MGSCTFSLLSLKLNYTRWILRSHGLHSTLLHLDNGSSIHCWAPAASPSNQKPPLLLLHGFGANGTIGWEYQIASLLKEFSLYLPDLLFFGQSITSNKQRSEYFQAECMWLMMQQLGVQQCIVVGHSYGGFVAFRMAHEYPQFVTRLVIVSSGICMDPRTNDSLLKKFGVTDIEEILVPGTTKRLRESFELAFNNLPWLPEFVYRDIFEWMSEGREGRLELLEGMILGKENAPALPRIEQVVILSFLFLEIPSISTLRQYASDEFLSRIALQDVLIIWGDQDQVFNIELAHRLKA